MEVSETDHNYDQMEGYRVEETAVLNYYCPPGYRFAPSDEELIMYYLIPKSQDQIFEPNCIISEITLSDYTPEEIAETDFNYDQMEGYRVEETAVLNYYCPPGYRFAPSDEELIMYYLIPKSQDQIFEPNCIISEITLSDYTPEEIAVRKSNNGKRRNRLAGDGYWRLANTTDVYSDNGVKIGSKSLLGFHRVIPNVKEEKTDWIMHEFSVLPSLDRKRKLTTLGEEDMLKLEDGYVLCQMYKRGSTKTNKVLRRSNKNTELQILPHNYVETAPANLEYHAHDDHDQNSMLLSKTPGRIDHGALTLVETPPSTSVSGENRNLGGLSSDAILGAVPPTAAADDGDELTAFLLKALDAEDYYYAQLMENSLPTTATTSSSNITDVSPQKANDKDLVLRGLEEVNQLISDFSNHISTPIAPNWDTATTSTTCCL
ncbi:NAC domain-containing protein 19 [Morus notabilis]|uniref:NAC domain-containing protein 19 n=1 Tax=Morus notabilis TaxID=981085 RepID=W9RKV4_9ROSA|nr:NAC transcription factor 56 [Morus notabilis]EXB79899.1 NAC domain-containing protein 19 [Morus notabilis]